MKCERIPSIGIFSDRKDNSRRLQAVNRDNRLVGNAFLNYYSWPIPLYELASVYVATRYRGRGYGSALMAAVEEFLKRNKRAGILSDAIEPNSPARGMYQRRGWTTITPGGIRYAFNLPEGMSEKELRAFYERRDERAIRRRQLHDSRKKCSWEALKTLDEGREEIHTPPPSQ